MFRAAQKLVKSRTCKVQCTTFFRSAHTEVEIPVPWGHISGKLWNENGSRPVLAVHGWQDNANTFDNLVPLLSPAVSVLSIDLPGHGYSSHFPPGFPYHRMTAVMALKRVVDHYGWKTVTLMGHSLGGQTCFMYAAIYPEQVDSFIALDILAPGGVNAKKFVEKGGKSLDSFLKRDRQKPETAPAYNYNDIVKMVANSPVVPVGEEAAKILLERGSVKTENGKYQFTRDPRLKDQPIADWSAGDLLKFCKGIKSNVLCMKAESSPYFPSKEFFDKCWANVKSSAKSADLKLAPGKHHVHLENPSVVAEIVNEFLEKYYSYELK